MKELPREREVSWDGKVRVLERPRVRFGPMLLTLSTSRIEWFGSAEMLSGCALPIASAREAARGRDSGAG